MMRLNASTVNHTETYDIDPTNTFTAWHCELPQSEHIDTTGDTATITCTICDETITATRLYKVDSRINCTTSCIFGSRTELAKAECTCECGGHNHGTGWYRTDTELWTPEQIAHTQRRIEKLRREQQKLAEQGRREADIRRTEWEEFLNDFDGEFAHHDTATGITVSLRDAIEWARQQNNSTPFIESILRVADNRDYEHFTNGRLAGLFSTCVASIHREHKAQQLQALRDRNEPPTEQEGRQELHLTITSWSKRKNPYSFNRFDMIYRITCLDARGWRINMTMPSKLKKHVHRYDELIDMEFTCMAHIDIPEHDEDSGYEYDPWFAFAKRPTKITIKE